MKKRSLVAAIAMLVVSAIVLTSATYAWFAANNTASLTAFSANVGNAAGSIYISADGTNWKSTLESTDFTGGIATTLVPVSYDPAADEGSGHFYGGAFTDDDSDGKSDFFTGTKTADTSYYTAITVHVYTETDGTVTVSPVLQGNYTSVPYVYASIKTADGQVICGTAADSYTPINVTGETTGTARDAGNPGNGIIESGEIISGLALGSEVTATAPASTSITFNITAGKTNAQDITFYVWAEGQDSSCVGTATGTPAFGLNFNFAAASSSSATNNG